LSLPILNRPFLIFSANSIPLLVIARVVESFEPQHRPNPLFHSPVVLFDQVIQVLARSDPVKEKYSCDVAVIPQRPAKALTTTHSAPGLLLVDFVVREK
jgi:hypothetical protein